MGGAGVGVLLGVVGTAGLAGVLVEEEEVEEASVEVSSSRPPKYLTACIHRPEGV